VSHFADIQEAMSRADRPTRDLAEHLELGEDDSFNAMVRWADQADMRAHYGRELIEQSKGVRVGDLSEWLEIHQSEIFGMHDEQPRPHLEKNRKALRAVMTIARRVHPFFPGMRRLLLRALDAFCTRHGAKLS
jgi:phage gp29-like protein